MPYKQEGASVEVLETFNNTGHVLDRIHQVDGPPGSKVEYTLPDTGNLCRYVYKIFAIGFLDKDLKDKAIEELKTEICQYYDLHFEHEDRAVVWRRRPVFKIDYETKKYKVSCRCTVIPKEGWKIVESRF